MTARTLSTTAPTDLNLARLTVVLALLIPYLALPLAISVVRRTHTVGAVHPVAAWGFWLSYAAAVALTVALLVAVIAATVLTVEG